MGGEGKLGFVWRFLWAGLVVDRISSRCSNSSVLVCLVCCCVAVLRNDIVRFENPMPFVCWCKMLFPAACVDIFLVEICMICSFLIFSCLIKR